MSTRNLPGVKGNQYVRLTSPPSVSRLSRENVGASTSHNPTGLHGLFKGWLYRKELVMKIKTGFKWLIMELNVRFM
jgi:hypothetical protein